MTKSEAAKILVTYTNVKARQYGVARVTKNFIEEMRTEALSEPTGSLLQQAAQVCPHWTTIRSAARRMSA